MSQRHVMLIDLDDEGSAITQYEAWHAAGALPEVIGKSIRDAGVVAMEIYRAGNRLVMIMETETGFDFARKASADAANSAVQAWEARMSSVQRPLPCAQPGDKWTAAKPIFSLIDQP